MSSFYVRKGVPECGDVADHPHYGSVQLMGIIDVEDEFDGSYWLVRCDDYTFAIVDQADLKNIGYYGD